jgi:hypothetical protein
MRLIAGEYLHRLIEMGAVITWVQDSGAQRTHAQELEGASWPSQQQRYRSRFIEERCAVAARAEITHPITVKIQSGADSVEAVFAKASASSSSSSSAAPQRPARKPYQLATVIWGSRCDTSGTSVMEAAVQDVRAKLIAGGNSNPDAVLRTVSAVHADEVVMHEAEQLAAQYGEAYVVSTDTDLLVLAACSSARVGVVLMGHDRTTAATAATQWGCSWKTQGILPTGASPGELKRRSSNGCGQLDFSYCLPADLAKEWCLPVQLLPLAAVCFGTDDTAADMTLQLHSALLQQTVDSEAFVKSFKGLSLDSKGRADLLAVARAKSTGGERRGAHLHCDYGTTCNKYGTNNDFLPKSYIS